MDSVADELMPKIKFLLNKSTSSLQISGEMYFSQEYQTDFTQLLFMVYFIFEAPARADDILTYLGPWHIHVRSQIFYNVYRECQRPI